jgi:hypothetical protein
MLCIEMELVHTHTKILIKIDPQINKAVVVAAFFFFLVGTTAIVVAR